MFSLQRLLKSAAGDTYDPFPLISNPWYTTAVLLLFVRRHAFILIRLCLLMLLAHLAFKANLKGDKIWTLTVANTIGSELMRFMSKAGDLDEDGVHYTLKIVQIISEETVTWIQATLFPRPVWFMVSIIVLSRLTIKWTSRRNIIQLLTHRMIVRLGRLLKSIWKQCVASVEKLCHWMVNLTNTGSLRSGIRMACSALISCSGLMDALLDNLMLVVLASTPASTFIPGFGRAPNRRRLYASSVLWLIRHWARPLTCFFDRRSSPPIYEPLRSLENARVLLLYPRFAWQPIRCSLLQGHHAHQMYYEAISYTWQDLECTEKIIIGGRTKKVTKSVYEILAEYSSILMPKVLWIDAICIDQDNLEEKNHQVKLMKQIYLNANLVTAWLGKPTLKGDDSQSSKGARDHQHGHHPSRDANIEQFNTDARLAFDLLRELEIVDYAFRNTYNLYGAYETLSPGTGSMQWSALLRLLRHPWFERVWVVQEVALAEYTKVRYGNETINWTTLSDGLRKLHGHKVFRSWVERTHGIRLRHNQTSTLYNAIRISKIRDHIRLLRQSTRAPKRLLIYPTLSRLLAESFYFKATDPRDLIYGLMGICFNPVEVNYASSVDEVYLGAAKSLLRSDGFSILVHASGRRTDLNAGGLPSWVPDWRVAPKYAMFEGFRAGGKVGPEFKITPNNSLQLSGFNLDTVAEVGPILVDTDSNSGTWNINDVYHLAAAYFQFVDQMDRSKFKQDPYPYASSQKECPLEALRKTVVANRHPMLHGHSTDDFLSPEWDDFSKSYLANALKLSLKKSDPKRSQRLQTLLKFRIVQLAMRTRRLKKLQTEVLPVQEWEENLRAFLQRPEMHDHVERKALHRRLEDMDSITEHVRHSCGGRRLCITRKGYIGLFPPEIMEGDLIYISPGIATPLALRLSGRSDTPANSKLLIGACYVHGVMYGEKAQGNKENLEIV